MKYIGIDLGGTNIAVGIVDADGQVLTKKSTKTHAERSADEIIADMAKTAMTLLDEAGVLLEDIEAVGVGSPGSVDPKMGVILSAPNLNFKNVELYKMLKVYIDKPIYIENDANCAALAEAKIGSARGTDHSVMITLGTGIGGGIVINGQLYTGFNNYGGEFGHMIIQMDGEPCRCGNNGCFEAYASASALIRDTKRAAEKDKGSLLWVCAQREGNFSGRTAFDAAKLGDKSAQAVVDRYIDHLAVGISNIIRIFQPQMVVVGGGVSHEGDGLFVPLAERVERMAYTNGNSKDKQTKIVAACLGNDAGIVGAALLGIKEKI